MAAGQNYDRLPPVLFINDPAENKGENSGCKLLKSSFSAVEVMEFMTVFNKLLLLMLAWVYRWPEISDLRCL